jgi:L-asparaginase / beta-aspartyl-peptidase
MNRQQQEPDESVITSSTFAPASGFSIVVHGGAGDVPVPRVPLHVAGCERAALAGAEVLANGGSALDAVERAVFVLEDDPLFNAGTGACLNAEEHIELDASIMDGTGLRAGGVCALPPFLHPIAIARHLLEEGRHVLLAAEGAARYAVEHGFVRADEAPMITELARRRLAAVRAKKAEPGWAGGTVGAVARDRAGRLAAATSTGGMVDKLPGRVGDSPIIGAGTYADDTMGACSTTGHGEAMMRVCAAKTAVDHMQNTSNAEAAVRRMLAIMHRRTNERGGAIVVAPDGSIGIARTTNTMSFAFVQDGTKLSGA